MTKPFCHYLTKQYRIEQDRVRPCCFFGASANLNDPKELELYHNYVSNVTDWIPECNVCKQREESGIVSPRQILEKNKEFTDSDDQIVSIQIQFDNICNAACLICGPWASTTWGKYLSNIDQKTPKVIKISQSDQTQLAEGYLDKIKNLVDFSQLKRIEFLGGEPLLTNIHEVFLNEIPVPENVELCYTTNLSCRPTESMLEMWRKFKQVVLQVSIDGTDDHHHYLRWPMRWNQLENNLKFILAQPGINYKMSGSFTLTPLSAFYHDRYVEWAKSFFNDTDISYTQIFSNPWTDRHGPMGIGATPQSLIDEIKSKYGDGHVISNIMEPHDPEKYIKFMDYIEYHDRHRQLNWREVFPEIQHHFK